MAFLGWILILLVLAILAVVALVLKTLRQKRFEKLSSPLRKWVRVLLAGTILGYFIAGVVSISAYFVEAPIDIWETGRVVYPVLLSFKLLIELVFYVAILRFADRLLKNVTNHHVFVYENALDTRKIGEIFLMLFVIEVLGALLLSATVFLGSGGTFEITTNETMFLQLIIGFVLLIVSSLFEQSIRLYEENKLTI